MNERRPVPQTEAAPLERGRPQQSFFVLRETPCPYVPGRMERKVVTELAGSRAADAYGDLSRAGFRRSHLFAYRPACRGCEACLPVRVAAQAYTPGKSLRRTARRNADLSVRLRPPRATFEQFRMFHRYLATRHPDGEMARMSFADYRPMVEETAAETALAEFRDPASTLVGACLVDLLDDGTSAVYSFFEPDQAGRSLGTYMVHWLVEETRRRGLDYVYLGYWIAESRKMAYKARFRPLQGLTAQGWTEVFQALE